MSPGAEASIADRMVVKSPLPSRSTRQVRASAEFTLRIMSGRLRAASKADLPVMVSSLLRAVGAEDRPSTPHQLSPDDHHALKSANSGLDQGRRKIALSPPTLDSFASTGTGEKGSYSTLDMFST